MSVSEIGAFGHDSRVGAFGDCVMEIKDIKKLFWPMFTGLAFILAAMLLREGIFYARADGVDMPGLLFYMEKAYIFLIIVGVVFLLRWLVADAPFSFLRRYTIAPLIRTISTLLIYFGAAFYILFKLFGINLTPLLTTSAVLTGIIVLSLQDTIKNLFTGLWINMDRIVAKGDWVKLGDKEGKVMEVTWRTTRLLTRQNDYIYIPNRLLAEGMIDNFSYPSPLHVVFIDIGASFGDPPHMVVDTLMEIASDTKGVLKDPPPAVWILHFGDFEVKYRLRASIEDYRDELDIKTEINKRIWYAFRRKRIEIPFPARTLYHHKPAGVHYPHDFILNSLKDVDFLAPLADEEMKRVAADAKVESFCSGEAMVRQGEPGQTCYFITSGSADVYVYDEAGRAAFIATLKKGEFFGEMSLLTGEPRKATVVAKEDSTCVVIDSAAFKMIFSEQPVMAEHLSVILARRLSEHAETVSKAASKVEAEMAAQRNILGRIKKFFKI